MLEGRRRRIRPLPIPGRLRSGAVVLLTLLVAGCAGPRDFVRPGVSWAETQEIAGACWDVAQDQVRSGRSSDGAISGGAVANLGAGGIRGVARSKAKNRLAIACMRERGFVGTTVSSQEREILRGPDSPERQALVEAIHARGDSDD